MNSLKKNKYLIFEILSVLALVSFVVLFILSHSGGTQKEISAVAAPVVQEVGEGAVTEQSAAEAVKTFRLDKSVTDGIAYYKNENIMDVTELLLVKVANEADAASVAEGIQNHVANQKNLNKNYAPQQYSLLQNSIIAVSGNTVFYCTAENANAVYEAFQKAL